MRNYHLLIYLTAAISFLFSYTVFPRNAEGQIASDYGTGPINLSPRITKYFKETYLSELNPWTFFVNKKGTIAYYTICPESGCNDDSFTMFKERCEKRAGGEKCYVFAQNKVIAWKGPVTFSSSVESDSVIRVEPALPNNQYGGDQLKEFLINVKMKYQSKSSFTTVETKLKSDGNVEQIKASGRYRYGKWWIKNNQMCIQYEGRDANCFDIYKVDGEKNKIKVSYSKGDFIVTVER